MGDLFGDAFAEDSTHRFYGRDVFEQNTQLSFSDLGDLAVSKSNNVSFLKVDDLDLDLRNILVVGESFICYSVTAKRTSIRAIDTLSGEKALLKGHETSILDLKLSLNDKQSFCSVDHGQDFSKPHIFVWKRMSGKSVDFEKVYQSNIPAKIVQPFPKGNAWGISDEHNIAILTAENASASNYSQLPFHISFDKNERACTFAFSPNGEFIAAIVSNENSGLANQYLQVWKLVDGGAAVKVYDQFHNQLRLNSTVAIAFLPEYIVTVSRDDQSFGSRDMIKTIPYVLKLWSTSDLSAATAPTAPPRNIQTLLVHLPEYRFRNRSITSTNNSALECDVRVESSDGRYLMMSSRTSNVLACFALSPVRSGSLPIHHVTYMDLKAPIVSMDVATILGREHHSSEEGEHVEVTAYQEEAADQSSIQQYHMLAKSLFDYSKYGAGEGGRGSVSPSPAASGGNSPHGHQNNTGSAILNMLSRVPSISGQGSNNNLAGSAALTPKSSFSAVAATPSAGEALVRTLSNTQQQSSAHAASSASSTSSGIDFTPSSMMADKAALDALQSRSAAAVSEQKQLFPSSAPATPATSNTDGSSAASSKPATATKSDLPDFLLNTTPKSNTPILSAFQRATSSNNGGLNAILNSSSSTAAATAESTSAAKEPSSGTANNAGKSLLSSLKGSAATPVSGTPATKTAEFTPAVTPSATAAASAASNTNAAAAVTTNTTPGAASAKTSLLSVLGKTAAAPTPTSSAAATAATPAAAPVAPATSTSSLSTTANTTTASAAVANGLGHDIKQDLLREMHHLHTLTITEMRSVLHQQHQVAQRNLQDMMLQMKSEISAQVTETLTTKVQQQLSTKLKESMRDTIRDTIRAYLQDAFRNAFESSLLPAFQSGIDRMFEQVNSSVDDGMEGVLTVLQEQQQEALDARAQVVATVSETAATLMKNNQSVGGNDAAAAVGVTPEMIGSVMKAVINVETMWKRTEQTVSQLQDMMAQMQALLVATHAANGGVVGASNVPAVVAKPTPDELLTQGKVAEAIIAALDNKNVDETVAVLAKLTPNLVNQKCSPLVRLCITQQLASDLSVNAPSEGIAKRLEWIKSLVVTIVRLPKPELDANINLKRNFPSMIQAVLESIQAAKEWIARAQYDNGEEDGASVDIPHSVHTDLQLLEFVVQTASF